MPRECRRRHDPVPLSLELQRHCPRARGIRGCVAMLSPIEVAFRLHSSLLRGCPLGRRREIHPRASGFREPDGDGLLRGARAMLSRADVLDLFVNEFTRLRPRGFSLSLVLSCSGQRSFVRHDRLPWRSRCAVYRRSRKNGNDRRVRTQSSARRCSIHSSNLSIAEAAMEALARKVTVECRTLPACLASCLRNNQAIYLGTSAGRRGSASD